MAILIGGKAVNASASKPAHEQLYLGKHRLLTGDQIKKRHPAEPFPPIAVFRNDTVEHRLSVASELKGWVEQRLGEMAPLVDESEWIRQQLRDPALEGHRMAQEARKRRDGIETLIAEYASDIAYLEAHCDRIWQSLNVDERKSMADAWVADVTDDRIICNAWTRIAQVGFTWPLNYRVNRHWFACLADPLIADMEEAGLKEGIAIGVIADPFESEEEV